MIRTGAVVAALVMLPLRATSAQQSVPALPADDRVRLAEAVRLLETIPERVWPGWEAAPSAILLVTDSVEYLIRHPDPSDDFTNLGRDSLLGTAVWARARVFPPGLLATFPAVGGVPTIVVGTPAATGKSPAEWTVTVLHEHFHQYQTSQADYYPGVARLGLAGDDTTGMWMLNYPFPYETPAVSRAFDRVAHALAEAIDAPDAELSRATARYRAARAELRRAIGAADDRYLEFQLWQEGVARWVELQAARAAASAPQSEAFRALPGVRPYAAVADSLANAVRAQLREPRLAERRRVAFYALGAGTAMLLDRTDPGWRSRYMAEPFRLSPGDGASR